MDHYAGEEGDVILAPPDGAFVNVRFKDNGVWSYSPSWLIPIPAKNEALLKVGDRVRVLCSNSNRPAGTILSIDRVDSADMDFPYHAENWWYSKDQVELVESNTVESVGISTPCIDAIKSIFGAGTPKESTTKLPLISKTKLLTTIKLD